jgi:hypothetical protein
VAIADTFRIAYGTAVTIYRTPDGRTWWDDDGWPNDPARRIVEVALLKRPTRAPAPLGPCYLEPHLDLYAHLRIFHEEAHEVPYTRRFARLDDLRRRMAQQLCEAVDAAWHGSLNARQLHDDLSGGWYCEGLTRAYAHALRTILHRPIAELAEEARREIADAPRSYDYYVGGLHPDGGYAWPQRAPGLEMPFGQLDAWVAVLALAEGGREIPVRAQIAAGYRPEEAPEPAREVERAG